MVDGAFVCAQIAVAGRGAQDLYCGHATRLDGVDDAFLGELIGQAGGIPGQGAPAGGDGFAATAEEDAVAASDGHLGVTQAEPAQVAVEARLESAAVAVGKDDTDGESAGLREDPGVAPRAVVHLHHDGVIEGHPAQWRKLHLKFPRRAGREPAAESEGLRRHGVRAIGADHERGLCFETFGADAHSRCRLLDGPDARPRPEFGARLLRMFEQQRVEAVAHDHVEKWLAGIADEADAVADGDVEEVDGLLDDRVDGEGEERPCAAGNAARAGLVTGEVLAVEDEDARPGGGKLARGCAPGGTGAHDDRIEACHSQGFYRGSAAGSQPSLRLRLAHDAKGDPANGPDGLRRLSIQGGA